MDHDAKSLEHPLGKKCSNKSKIARGRHNDRDIAAPACFFFLVDKGYRDLATQREGSQIPIKNMGTLALV